jgi:hypothetical protein
MADHELLEDSGPPSLASRVWAAITKDGHLAAAGRQGADELATALKAFPDSIGVDEPGTIWNPTQGEIAAEREERAPSPSEIARSKQPYSTEQDRGNDHDHGRDR